MIIKKCGRDDCKELACLNKQLIEDEGHDNPMSADELQARMEGFIAGEYKAFYFTIGSEVVGYALVKMTATPYYLRQFFICRQHRRKGIGRQAFSTLLKYLDTTIIDIEVLSLNHTGVVFWESLGFKPRSVAMRYDAKLHK